jgi:YfiH family protein
MAVTHIPFRFPGLPRVGCAFSLASAGHLSLDNLAGGEERHRTARARRHLLHTLGLSRWSEQRQTHGVALVANPLPTSPDEASSRESDGQCTDAPGLALAIKTADCQPVLLAHRGGKHIAALHVGWRGNALDFPVSGVHAFCRAYNLEPEDLLAVRGPSLGPGAAQFVNFEQEWPARFMPWFNGQSRTMNLWRLTSRQLVQAGLRPENVFSLDLCTYSLPGAFFSHRRGDVGRQISLVWLEED